MAEIHVVWHGRQILEKVKREAARRLNKAAGVVARQIKLNISRPSRKARPSGQRGTSFTGEFPSKDRGILTRSIFHALVSDDTAIVGVASGTPAAKYARRLEEGGEIRSLGKNMAVPISPQAKAHSYSGGPRTFNRPLTKISRRGKPSLLVEIPKGTGKSRSKQTKAWVIHYLLTPMVRIGARPYISRTVREMVPQISKILGEPMQL